MKVVTLPPKGESAPEFAALKTAVGAGRGCIPQRVSQ